MKVFISAIIIAVVSSSLSEASPSGGGYGGHGGHGHANYKYGYDVHDSYHKTNFGHHESRNGYGTQGQYHVHLPDGRLQTVTYHVGDGYSGYVADVKYSGGHGGYGHGGQAHGGHAHGGGHGY